MSIEVLIRAVLYVAFILVNFLHSFSCSRSCIIISVSHQTSFPSVYCLLFFVLIPVNFIRVSFSYAELFILFSPIYGLLLSAPDLLFYSTY